MRRLSLNPLFLPPWIALVILVLLAVVPLAIAALTLKVNNSAEAYIPQQSEAAIFERQLRERFPGDEVLVAAFAGEDLYTDTFFERFEQLVVAMQQHALVERVLAPSTMDHISGTADGFVVEPLLDQSIRSPLDPAEWRARLLSDRFAPGLLVSDDGSLIALAVRPHELEDSLQRLSIETAFLQALEEAGIEAELVAMSGQTPLDAAQLRATLRDSVIFVPATLIIGLVLIAWLFRRWLALAVALAVIQAGVGTALLMLVLLGQPFTLITAILSPLMVSLSVALLLHWYNALAMAMRRSEADVASRSASVLRAWTAIHRPAFLTALTTAAGLISLSMSEIPPIHALGQSAAVGVLMLYLIVAWILPPIFARWDRGDWARSGRGISILDAPVAWLRHIGMRYPRWVLLITLLLLALGAPQVAQVEVESDLFRFFRDDHPITQSNQVLTERLSGVTALEVVFEAPARDALKQVEVLRQLQAFREWISERPEVDRVTTLVDMIEEMHWGFHAEDPDYRRLPDQSDLIAQYLFIYDGQDLYELVDRDFRITRVLLNLNVNGSSKINAMIADIREHLDQQALGALTFEIAGFGRLFGDQERLLVEGQIRGLMLAVGLIFLLMAVIWRSVPAALLCMVPNLSPILVIFIVMGLFGIWLDMATAMITGIAVGIAVDDTIHVYHGYRSRRLRGLSPVWALARTYQHAGRAVTATTLILSAQFLLLTSSPFVPTTEFGLLTALGLVTALLFDLLVLPALLMVTAGWWWSRRRSNLPPQVSDASDAKVGL
ncbi:MAG: MMPL family transporter [Lamprobacter sp.]|uniref:efflux RND transporter permease subunit n=1 Tax=Lamprobacter sp. TaxID=3100796 RepID=UPI002B258642|nr:MMPL family transporter [Lamprobacter sp.]MEA3641363.1 MMPL family transporter [Lamprobacter sp.]